MTLNYIFDGGRVDIKAADERHILLAIDNVEIPFVIHVNNVAGIQPRFAIEFAQHVAAVAQRFAIERIELDGALVALQRPVHLTHCAQHIGAVDQRPEMVGICLQHAAEFFQRLVQASHFVERHAATVVKMRGEGIDFGPLLLDPTEQILDLGRVAPAHRIADADLADPDAGRFP